MNHPKLYEKEYILVTCQTSVFSLELFSYEKSTSEIVRKINRGEQLHMERDAFKPMLFSVLKGYNGKQFTKDLIAGIIVAIIALPLSIALALASGVSPEKGIYTAIVAGFVISFLGGSTVQIAGPTAAFATIVAGIVAKNGFDGLVIATIMAGIILILMGLFRLGTLIKFIPYTFDDPHWTV